MSVFWTNDFTDISDAEWTCEFGPDVVVSGRGQNYGPGWGCENSSAARLFLPYGSGTPTVTARVKGAVFFDVAKRTSGFSILVLNLDDCVTCSKISGTFTGIQASPNLQVFGDGSIKVFDQDGVINPSITSAAGVFPVDGTPVSLQLALEILSSTQYTVNVAVNGVSVLTGTLTSAAGSFNQNEFNYFVLRSFNSSTASTAWGYVELDDAATIKSSFLPALMPPVTALGNSCAPFTPTDRRRAWPVWLQDSTFLVVVNSYDDWVDGPYQANGQIVRYDLAGRELQRFTYPPGIALKGLAGIAASLRSEACEDDGQGRLYLAFYYTDDTMAFLAFNLKTREQVGEIMEQQTITDDVFDLASGFVHLQNQGPSTDGSFEETDLETPPEDTTTEDDVPGDCPPAGPGGSSFDGAADGPRFVAPGGYPATYVPPTGEGEVAQVTSGGYEAAEIDFELETLTPDSRIADTSFGLLSLTGGATVVQSAGVGIGNDNQTGAITLPFTFNFFGTNYTSVYIYSNGALSFNATQDASLYSQDVAFPTTDQILNAIMGGFGAYFLSVSGTIKYQTLDSTPNQKFVVEWRNCPVYDDHTKLCTHQIILHEDGRIEFQTEAQRAAVNDTYPWTQGAHNADGTEFIGFSDRNNKGQPAFDIINTGTIIDFSQDSGATLVSVDNDDQTGAIALPFSFTFFGIPYTELYIYSNGALSFNASQDVSLYSQDVAFPTTAQIVNSIMGGFGAYDRSVSGTIKYDTLGTAPTRRFVVEWRDCANYDDNSKLSTHQIILHEDGRIEFQTEAQRAATDDTYPWTQGVQSAAGDTYVGIAGRNNVRQPSGDLIESGTLLSIESEDTQSLEELTKPEVSADLKVCDGTIYRVAKSTLPRLGLAPMDARVLRFADVPYPMADRFGSLPAQTWSMTLADEDGLFRGLLATGENRFYKRWTVDVYIEDDAARLAGTERQRLYRGRCVSVRTEDDQTVALVFSDEYSRHDSPYSLDRELPHLLIGDIFGPGASSADLGAVPTPPDDQIAGHAATIMLGECSDEYRADENVTPIGVCQLHDLGDVSLGSEVWRALFVCLYASYRVPALFGSNLDATCPASVRLDPALYNGDEDPQFLVPGYAPWDAYFANKYIEVQRDGVTYWATLIFGRGPIMQQHLDNVVPLSANVDGVEDVGDGTGNLIDDISRQVQWLIDHPLLRKTTSGVWGDAALFPDGISKVRTSDFEAIRLIHNARLSTRFRGSIIIDTQRAGRDWLADICVSAGIRLTLNQHGQVGGVAFDTRTTLTSLRTFTDLLHIRDGSFKITSEISGEVENSVDVQAGPEPSSGRFTVGRFPIVANDSIENWGDVYTAQPITFVALRRADVAQAVGGERLIQTQDGITRGTFGVDLAGGAVHAGELLRLTHLAGIGPLGWRKRVVMATNRTLIIEDAVSPGEGWQTRVDFEDVHPILVMPGSDDEDTPTSRFGFSPLGSEAGNTATVLGSEAAGTAPRLG